MNYNWIVSGVETVPQENGLNDVIKIIHWRLELIDNELIVDEFGAFALAPADPSSFVDFDNLSQPDIINWLEAGLAIKHSDEDIKSPLDIIKEKLQIKMSERLSPPTVFKVLI